MNKAKIYTLSVPLVLLSILLGVPIMATRCALLPICWLGELAYRTDNKLLKLQDYLWRTIFMPWLGKLEKIANE